MGRPCKYELEVLRECAGEKPARGWGAAVGQALECLRGSGYIDANGEPTPKGLAALRDAKEAQP
jgi:hypothetical protein